MREAEFEERSGWLSWLWVALAAAAGVATIIVLVTQLAAATRDRDTALRLQGVSSERITLAASFESAMARSEAALGRFVISGDNALGTLYADDWRNSGVLLDRLATASRDDAARAKHVAELRAAWETRGNELADTALRTTYRQNEQALATYYKIRTSPALDRLTGGIAQLIGRERDELAKRNDRVDTAVARANLLTTMISVVGVLLVAGVGALAFLSLNSSQRRRREADRAEALEDAVAERTAELSASHERLVAEMATREAAEAQLRQAQKMDAVGQLTGGIAHDFNNMLAVVLGGVELAKRRISDGKDDPVRHLDSAMEGASRAAALTKRLLAFARTEPLLPAAADPDALIAGMSDLLDRTLGERIAIRHISRAGGWPIFVDRHQLENAILNLAVNARDAMEHGGTLTVATAQVTLRNGDVADLDAGDYVRIAISDTGTGMDRAVLDRIFEPFFTTKETGKGTGLGLSQVFGYMRQSHGTVTVDSAVGTGTTVSLYLPRHTTMPAALPIEATPGAVTDRTAKLLLIEDDRRVLAATTDALAELGHMPVACLGIEAAEAALDAHPEIELVVSDVLMPGLTGPELVGRLRQQRPGLKALFVTGYTGDAIDAAEFGDDPVLRKPFTIAALQTAVDAVLAQQSTPPLETRAAA